MTASVILIIVVSTAVLTAVLGLLVWSIATQHRSLFHAEIHTGTRRTFTSRRAALDQPRPLRA